MSYLSDDDKKQFHQQGYLVIENLIDAATLAAVRSEYSALMDKHYADWQAAGMVPPTAQDASFWDKLSNCYLGGFDWYQPFDISLPHNDISEDTPMHFGPAVFDMVRHKGILDMVESLIGPEINSMWSVGLLCSSLSLDQHSIVILLSSFSKG